MDDLDEFLDKVTVTPQTDRHPAMETDEDFLAFLDTPSTFSLPDGASSTAGKFSLTTQSVDDSNDFLDWLQDSTSHKHTSNTNLPAISEDAVYSPNSSFLLDKDPITTTTANNNNNNNNSSASPDSKPRTASFSSPGMIKEVSRDMDNFFNEVFGSPSPSTKSRKTLSYDANDPLSDTPLSFEETVQSIVSSAFPDITTLRSVILAQGYVPNALRAQVWSLLLNESCAEDSEVLSYSSEGVQVEGGDLLHSDVEAVVAAYNSTTTTTNATNTTNTSTLTTSIDKETLRKDLTDILSLYCARRQVAYSSVYCRLLAPLLVVPEPASRATASSCFYSLASEFAPLINLNLAAYTLSVSVVHSLLRLLLSYHSPALVQHLDRVLPHWEAPAAEISTHQSARIVATHKRNSELDELEKELGLDLLDSGSSTGTGGSSGGSEGAIESALPIREHGSLGIAGESAPRPTGILPTSWVTSVFSGSVPPVQAAQLLDYAVLTNCQFAGVYFSAALLHLHSTTLLTMTGPRIRQWVEEVAMNKADWYTTISVTSGSSGASSSDTSSGGVKSWESFVNGWIHCTTALIRSTPQAFKDSLPLTSEWATLKAEYKNNVHVHTAMKGGKKREKNTGDLDKISHGEDPTNTTTNTTTSANNTGTSVNGSVNSSAVNSDVESGDEGLDSDEDEETENVFPTKVNFMAQFRRFSAHFTPEQAEKEVFHQSRRQKLASYPHEKVYTGGNSALLCLSASVEEVIPCICSNKRRAIAPDDLLHTFTTAINTTSTSGGGASGSSGSSGNSSGGSNVYAKFSNVAEAENNKPFYFGIDCRSVAERSLGQFPKAYAFDPALLTDTDEVVKLLDMVETMAASAHLCLIGSGEGYLRWAHAQQSKRSSTSSTSSTSPLSRDSPEVVRAIEDHYLKLNAVAMFFLKRSFKHVSILSGGFMAAAQYLHLPDSPLSLTAALVDSDRGALESLLGIQPANTTKRDLSSYLPDVTAPSKLLSVTSYFTNKTNTSGGTSGGVEGEGGSSANRSRSASPVPGSSSGASSTTSTTNTATNNLNANTSTSTTTSNTTTTASADTPSVLSSWGKKLSLFSTTSVEALKKSVASVSSGVGSAAGGTGNVSGVSGEGGDVNPSASTDEYEDDGMGPREFADTTSISISRTEREKEQALSMHKMAGLRKGDKVMINRADLPGAILFPSIKYKEVWVEVVNPTNNTTTSTTTTTGITTSTTADSSASTASSGVDGPTATTTDVVGSAATTTEGDSPEKPTASAVDTNEVITASTTSTTKVAQTVQVHRYLVVSRERFLVLDAAGGGVGSEAVVKSNRHLTELMKMTFKKKDPELVTLFFVCPEQPAGKSRQYRVSKRQEFVTALQKNMERFK